MNKSFVAGSNERISVLFGSGKGVKILLVAESSIIGTIAYSPQLKNVIPVAVERVACQSIIIKKIVGDLGSISE